MAAAKNGAPAFGELNTVPGALQQTHTKGAFKLADRARKHPAQNVCFRKGIGQEVAWAKFQAMLQSMLADVLVEHRLDLKLCRDVFKQGVAVGVRYGFDGLPSGSRAR
jgi:hypothetical protein